MTLKDQQQLRKIKKGEIYSFEKLFHRFSPGMCSYAERLIRKEEVAEEIVQDVFYNIWKNRVELRITKSWQSYLYRSVYNNSMMYLRKTRKEVHLDELKANQEQSTSPDPLENLHYQEVSELMSLTLESLPERTREIFHLNRLEGLKYREIAVKLSISVKTVESNMGKALKAFRTSLKKFDNQE